jgi:predicted MFS family arabinose efflux permease
MVGGGLLSLTLPGGEFMLLLSGFMAGCGHGLLYPSLNVLAIRGEPPHMKGKITGVFTGSIDAGVFVGSVVLGYIGRWAGFSRLFLTAGMALILAFVIFQVQTMRQRAYVKPFKKGK